MNEEIQSINLDDYTQIGEGGNGKTYVNPAAPGEILKVNSARMSTWEAVKREYDISRAVADLGIVVPATYRIVRVGKAYATISQRIEGKRSLSRICHDEPQRTEEMARLLCSKGRELFATQCNTQLFPSRRDQALLAIKQSSFVSRKNRERLRTFVESIAEDSHCLHGDFQPEQCPCGFRRLQIKTVVADESEDLAVAIDTVVTKHLLGDYFARTTTLVSDKLYEVCITCHILNRLWDEIDCFTSGWR